MPRKTNFARHLRRHQTSAEDLLWQELRSRRCGGYKFRRQVPKDKFVVDFLCESQKLIVEVDGPTHEGPDEGIQTSQSFPNLSSGALNDQGNGHKTNPVKFSSLHAF